MHSSFVTGGSAVPIYFLHTGNSDAVLGGLSAKARAFAVAAGYEAKPGKLLLVPGDDGAIGAVLFGLEAPDAKTKDLFRVAARRRLSLRQCTA
jgi:leucyl aminopeptidase